MGRAIPLAALLVLALAFAACGGDEEKGDGIDWDRLSKMATPRDSVEYQFELIKAGRAEDLVPCFTARLRERITPDAVAAGAREVSGMSLDELFSGVEASEVDGHEAAKVKMGNGRTLTTLVLTDGKWLADTIWFK